MKRILFFLFTSLVILLASCTQESIPTVSQDGEVGMAVLTFQIGLKGGVKRSTKGYQTDSDSLSSKLVLEVRSNPLTTTYNDTLYIGEGVSDTFQTYELPVDFDWTVKAGVYGGDGLLTHGFQEAPIKVSASGDDTVCLNLPATVSYFKVGFQCPNGGKTAFLRVDDILVDTAHMDTMGEYIELSYPGMSASPEGIEHHVLLEIKGDMFDSIDVLLYRGDTTITAVSGDEFQVPFNLEYIGPGSEKCSALDFQVQVGIVGRIIFNAKLEKPHIIYLERNGPWYINSGTKGVALEFSALEDGFTKYLDNLKFEASSRNFYKLCDRAYLVHDNDTLSQIAIDSSTGIYLSFRDVNLTFYDECELKLVLRHLDQGVNQTPTSIRFKCIRINGRTSNGIRVGGYFFNGNIESPWSELCYLGS